MICSLGTSLNASHLYTHREDLIYGNNLQLNETHINSFCSLLKELSLVS
jgi:hypothetical protein